MKIDKDVVLAIVIGVIIGGLSAFFVFFLPKLTSKTPPEKEKKEMTQEEPVSTPAPPSPLIVESPQDEAVFSEEETSVSGKPGILSITDAGNSLLLSLCARR